LRTILCGAALLPAAARADPTAPVEAPSTVETAKAEVQLTLLLVSMTHRTPVVGAEVIVTHRKTGEEHLGESDAEGKVRMDLPKADYDIWVSHPDFDTWERGEGLFKAGEVSLEVRLRVDQGMVITAESEFKGIQRQVIQAEELKVIPGAFGDPIRALQSLPGVARPAGVEGDIILRGAEASNTGFYFDEMPIPYVFHPFIGKSIVDPALVDDVEFYAGGMPSRFGEVLQGVVNIRTGVQPVEGIHQHVDVNLFDGGYAIEMAKDRWVIRGGGRYSWIGGMLGGLTRLASDSFRPLVIPKYWDLSLHADLQATAEDRWSLNLLSTRDKLILNFEDEVLDALEDSSTTELPFDPDHLIDAGFLRLRLRHQHEGESRSTDTWIAAGPETRQNLIGGDLSNQVGVRNGRIGGQALVARHESGFDLGEGDRALLGGQAQARWLTVEDFTEAYTDAGVVETDETQFFAALWTDWQSHHGPWTFVPGLRGGLYHFNDLTQVLPEPRLSLTRRVSDELSLKAFLGRFGQSPSMEMTAQGVGNPSLGLMKAWQLSMGADWIDGPWTVDSSIYGSVMNGLVQEELRVRYATQSNGYAYEDSYPYYVATTGYAFGWETLVRLRPSGPFFGWLALNLGKSIRVDEEDNIFPSDADIPVSVTLLGAWNAPHDWTLSGRYRITSGRPYTELHGVYDVSWDFYRPLTGEINAGRLPVFQQLDVRVDKTWSRARSDRTLYLDIQNLTWAKNPIFAAYNYNYTQLVPGLYIPTLALMGLEVSF
jgi:hypothetical protein